MVGNTVDYQVNLAATVVSDELAYEGEKGLGVEVTGFEPEVSDTELAARNRWESIPARPPGICLTRLLANSTKSSEATYTSICS